MSVGHEWGVGGIASNRWVIGIALIWLTTAAAVRGVVAQGAERGGTGGNAVRASKVPPELRVVAAQCESCHTVEPVLSHPTGMAPGMRLPEGFLLEGGRVTCITCHEDTAEAHARARKSGGKLLRQDSAENVPGSFCMNCHTGASMSRVGQHPTAISRAHLAWPRGVATRRFPGQASVTPVQEVSREMDGGFRNCLSCHDGTVASDSFTGVMASSVMRGGFTGMNHPVGMRYGGGDGERALVAAGALDARIRLEGGTVTCTTCHSLYSPEVKLLVMSNQRSSLCTACHTMQ